MAVTSITPVNYGEVKDTNLAIKARCEFCIHLTGTPAPGHGGNLCSSMGVIPDSPPCVRFTPTPMKLGKRVLSAFMDLSILNKEELARLALLVNAEARNRKSKHKFKIGDLVYFLPYGKDYICNYKSGYVMGYVNAGKQVLIAGGNAFLYGEADFRATLSVDSVLDGKDWRIKLGKLIDAGLVNEPASTFKIRKVDLDYVPPTIDSELEEVESTVKSVVKRKGKKRLTRK